MLLRICRFPLSSFITGNTCASPGSTCNLPTLRARRNSWLAGIRRFANHQGATQKYHHTLTLAWMRLVASALVETPEKSTFEQFMAAHPELSDKNLLAQYYSKELLQSAAAREGWVEPDLQPLPGLRIYRCC